MGNNSAGLKNRQDSLKSLISQLRAGVLMLQETKLYRTGTIKLQNMCIFEKLRGLNEGGGLLTAVHENLKPVQIPVKSDGKISQNILVVEGVIGKIKVRFINAYGVQETASVEERSVFYMLLEQEIQSCINSGCYLCLELDANAKVGGVIQNNPQDAISPNGQLLLDVLERNNLILVNGTSKCAGKITRSKNKKTRHEKSILDYFVVCQEFFQLIKQMFVDEDKKYVLKRHYKARGQVKVVESDHNPIYLLIDLPWDTKIIKPRLEVFNLRNSECQANFLENTNCCDILTSCLINKDIRVGGKLWLKNMKFLIHANFKKIRLNGKSRVDEKIQSLFEKQSQMQKDTPEFLAAESGIAEAIWEKSVECQMNQTIFQGSTCGRLGKRFVRNMRLPHQLQK